MVLARELSDNNWSEQLVGDDHFFTMNTEVDQHAMKKSVRLLQVCEDAIVQLPQNRDDDAHEE